MHEYGQPGSIEQVENEASSSQANHVDVRLWFIGGYDRKGVLRPIHVTTHDMLADILTKPISAPRITDLREAIGLE